MIKIEHVETIGWEAAIRGMRNPMNSWDKSDTCFADIPCYNCPEKFPGLARCSMTKHNGCLIGANDRNLMKRLCDVGTDHRKFMRMIIVYMDITAPLYWWKEFDTYKVGTVANSCSTMHKIADKEFTLDDFSHEHLEDRALNTLKDMIDELNYWREYYLSMKGQNVVGADKKAKDIWWQMIQLLPSSYNQKRTVMLNYEVLANIYKSRKTHKLDEWREFCNAIRNLLYSELITGSRIDLTAPIVGKTAVNRDITEVEQND